MLNLQISLNLLHNNKYMNTPEDYLSQLQGRIQFRHSKDFLDFKESEIENRKAKFLNNAITAARMLKPEYAFEATHWLLMYAALEDMTTGSLNEMEVGVAQLTDKPV